VQVQVARTLQNQDYEVQVEDSAAGGLTAPSKKYTSGELHVKGPNVFKGYWKNSKATQEAFTQDGWFRTGETTHRSQDVNCRSYYVSKLA
jgi:long-subunit acyl-CoA synthetase (AMP-forming)